MRQIPNHKSQITSKAKLWIGSWILVLGSSVVYARPLLTETAATMGRHSFEGGFAITGRRDDFGARDTRYTSVDVPVHVRFGFYDKLDIGVRLQYFDHRLEQGGVKFSGSAHSLYSPEIKLGLGDNTALLAIWHLSEGREGGQELPISRGNDVEVLLAGRVPTQWPLHLNLGYVFKRRYSTDFGVTNSPLSQVEPGHIIESRMALEIPWRYALRLLTELAHYYVDHTVIEGVKVTGSAGQALDALVGLSWEKAGVILGVGVAFGLLDESHTSFDLERGAGDVSGKIAIAYRLTPARERP